MWLAIASARCCTPCAHSKALLLKIEVFELLSIWEKKMTRQQVVSFIYWSVYIVKVFSIKISQVSHVPGLSYIKDACEGRHASLCSDYACY